MHGIGKLVQSRWNAEQIIFTEVIILNSVLYSGCCLLSVCTEMIANFKNSLLKGVLVSRFSRSGDNEKDIWHSLFPL